MIILESMRVLQISVPDVYPPKKGGAHRKHGLVMSFPESGDKVVRYSFGGEYKRYKKLNFTNYTEISNGYIEIKRLHPLFDISKIQVLCGRPYIYLSYILSYYIPRDLKIEIDSADMILVEKPWLVPPLAEYSQVPLAYSSHNVEAELYSSFKDKNKKLFDKIVELEENAVKQSDLLICTSKRDSELFKEKYSFDTPTFISPNGTYEDNLERTRSNYSATNNISLPSKLTGVFVGSKHQPNIEAAKICIEIIKELNGRGIDIQLLLIGKVCDGLETDIKQVKQLGFVDNLEKYLHDSDIALNPIVSGGGTNIKVFNYFSKELPVVMTPFGARGICVENGKHCLIHKKESLADGVQKLVDNPQLRTEIGKNAKNLVKEKYTWEKISSDLNSKLKRLFDIN